MANPFQDFEDERLKLGPQASTSANPFQSFEDERLKEIIPKVPESPGVLAEIDGFLRNINKGMTLGAWDKIVGMLPGRSAESEEKKTADYAGRHPYLAKGGEIVGGVAPSALMSTGIGGMIPGLAKQTIPRLMAREGLTGGGISAAEDLIKGEKPDALKAGTSALIGGTGAGVVGALGRVLSPSINFRASGVDVPDAAKPEIAQFMGKSEALGNRLSIPEAVGEIVPGSGARVQAGYNSATRLPEGSIARGNFDAARQGNLEGFISTIKQLFGGGAAEGTATQTAAKGAIKDANDLINRSAKPYYDAAIPDRVPALPASEARRMAEEAVASDRIKMAEILKTPNPARAGIPRLDAARQTMGDMFETAEKNAPSNSMAIARDKDALTRAMRGASPNFAQALDIESAGKSIMLNPLKAGPLGQVAATNVPKAQAEAVFGVNSPAGRDASIGALKRMDANTPGSARGVFQSRIDHAAEAPINFSSRLAPTAEGQEVVRHAAGDNPIFADMLRAARARDPATPRPYQTENSDGPISFIFDKLQNAGSGRLAEMYHDPANILKLGTVGGGQQSINSAITSAGVQAAPQLTDPMQGVMAGILPEPLVVDVNARDKKRKRRREED